MGPAAKAAIWLVWCPAAGAVLLLSHGMGRSSRGGLQCENRPPKEIPTKNDDLKMIFAYIMNFVARSHTAEPPQTNTLPHRSRRPQQDSTGRYSRLLTARHFQSVPAAAPPFTAAAAFAAPARRRPRQPQLDRLRLRTARSKWGGAGGGGGAVACCTHHAPHRCPAAPPQWGVWPGVRADRTALPRPPVWAHPRTFGFICSRTGVHPRSWCVVCCALRAAVLRAATPCSLTRLCVLCAAPTPPPAP